MTVVVAAALALTAVVVYTANTARPRASVAAPASRLGSNASLAELGARAATARGQLDTEQMVSLVADLDEVVTSTTLATKANAAKVELLELHAAIALEAAMRAELDPVGREAAQKLAAKSIAKARELGVDIGDDAADLGRVDAALARAELAAGTDLTDTFPVVLLPSFRDPELRAAALSIPLWRGPAPDDVLAKSLVAQLKATDRQTALVRLLTARALAATGADDAAAAAIDDVLSDVPRQPLALALQRSLRAPAIAVASPPDEDDEPTLVADPVPATPTKPAPTPEPTPTKPDPVAEPTPDPTPEPTPEPTPAKPEPTEPKPKPAKPEGESKKKYDTLLADGCKLVRGGDAQAGFDLLKQAFDLNPNAVAVTVCMAEAHLALGREASARALCDRALRKSPSDRRALLLAAELELQRGNEGAALEHYKKILENHPDDSKAKAYVESHGG
jgi:tetratricopeptide (TPR) repeat protein